jgi:hypothetical protein
MEVHSFLRTLDIQQKRVQFERINISIDVQRTARDSATVKPNGSFPLPIGDPGCDRNMVCAERRNGAKPCNARTCRTTEYDFRDPLLVVGGNHKVNVIRNEPDLLLFGKVLFPSPLLAEMAVDRFAMKWDFEKGSNGFCNRP